MLAKEILLKLYNYHYWATGKIMDCAEGVSQPQFLAPVDFEHESLRETLFHILNAELNWRCICQGLKEQTPQLHLENFPTVNQLRERWQEEEQRMRSYLSELSEDELEGTVQFEDSSGEATSRPRWILLVQNLTHSMQHRTEAAAILTSYGRPPGGLDFIDFVAGH